MPREVAKATDTQLTEPGTWAMVADAPMFVCPNLHVTDLSSYTITPDGVVDPPVQCLETGCMWRDQISLTGWQEDA